MHVYRFVSLSIASLSLAAAKPVFAVDVKTLLFGMPFSSVVQILGGGIALISFVVFLLDYRVRSKNETLFPSRLSLVCSIFSVVGTLVFFYGGVLLDIFMH